MQVFAIEESDYKIYAIQDRFDICDRARDIDEMKNTLDRLEALNMRDSNGKERAIVRSKIIIAAHERDEKRVDDLMECIQEKGLRLNTNVLSRKVSNIIKNVM